MPDAPLHVANNILRRAFREGVPLTPMKLQRILWFTAAEYAKSPGEVLLAEQFEPWPYGPVLRSVDTKFRPFDGIPVDKYSRDAKGVACMVREDKDLQLAAALDAVWAAAKDLSPVVLSRITHLPGSAWCEAAALGHMRIGNDLVAADVSYRLMLGL